MFRMKESKVYGAVRNPWTSEIVKSFPQGQLVVLRSDNGSDWFLSPASMLNARRRQKGACPTLSDREKAWIDMIELPIAGVDYRTALRMGFRTGGGE